MTSKGGSTQGQHQTITTSNNHNMLHMDHNMLQEYCTGLNEMQAQARQAKTKQCNGAGLNKLRAKQCNTSKTSKASKQSKQAASAHTHTRARRHVATRDGRSTTSHLHGTAWTRTHIATQLLTDKHVRAHSSSGTCDICFATRCMPCMPVPNL